MLLGCFNKWSRKNLACKTSGEREREREREREIKRVLSPRVPSFFDGGKALVHSELKKGGSMKDRFKMFQVLLDHSELQL